MAGVQRIAIIGAGASGKLLIVFKTTLSFNSFIYIM